MQQQNNSTSQPQDQALNDIQSLSIQQRREYALSTMEYLSRLKPVQHIKLSKWKNNNISQLDPKRKSIIKANYNAMIFMSLKQLICQMVYLIFSCMINKVNVVINKNIHLHQNGTVLGAFYFSKIDFEENPSILDIIDKNFFKIVEIEAQSSFKRYANSTNSEPQLKSNNQSLILVEKKDTLFYNFQFRKFILQNEMKHTILHTINAFLGPLLQSIEEEQISLLTADQRNYFIEKVYDQIQTIQSKSSDIPLTLLAQIERQVELMKSCSIYFKQKCYSIETILMDSIQKVQHFSEILCQQSKFCKDFIEKYITENHYPDKPESSIIIYYNQQSNTDFNYVNFKGNFVIEDSFFKSFRFAKSPMTLFPDHFVLQAIQNFKRQMLLKKTAEIIGAFQMILELEEEQEESHWFSFESEWFLKLNQSANKSNLKESTLFSEQINMKLYNLQRTCVQQLKTLGNQQDQLLRLIDSKIRKQRVQVSVFKLQIYNNEFNEQARSRNETLEEEKTDIQTKNPFVEFLWVIHFLRNSLSEKEMMKCEMNQNSLSYLPEIRLVCPQKLKKQAFSRFEKCVLKFQSEASSSSSFQSLTIDFVQKGQDYRRAILRLSFSQHNLNNLVLPLIEAAGILLTYYFNFQRILDILESMSFTEESTKGTTTQYNQGLYEQECFLLPLRIPHQMQLTKALQFSLHQRLQQF